MNRTAQHSALVRSILATYGAIPGLLLVQNDTGVARFMRPSGAEAFVHYGFPSHNGGPDLLGVLAPHARLFGLELKTGGAVVKPEQRKTHETLAHYGVRVFVVRTVKDAGDAIDELRTWDGEPRSHIPEAIAK